MTVALRAAAGNGRPRKLAVGGVDLHDASLARSTNGAAFTYGRAVDAPDLLDPTPTRRVDGRKAGETLTFAFAQGVAGDTWHEMFAAAALPKTRFSVDAFARDLFVADLVAGCRTTVIDGVRTQLPAKWLERVLSRPPEDVAVVEFRRAILGELAEHGEQRKALEDLHGRLRELLDQLQMVPARNTDVLRRRLDILATVKACLEFMAASFPGVRSGLARIPAFASEVMASDGYRALLELLDYDDHLATVDVRVRVGSDGRVRGLALAKVEENTRSRFARTPLGRWVARLVLLFRGFRFDAEELIARAVEQVFEGLEQTVLALMQLSYDLAFYLAALSFRANAQKAGLDVCLPSIVDEGGTRIEGLWNPLLLAHEKHIVPSDVAMDPPFLTLLTGPNSGGKTRLLQSIGLCQLLGQCGFFVPARSATLRRTHGIFASFGQPPAADASEGRLGTELLRVRALFETLPVGGLVLVDELCSGTNPSEGEDLFRLVLTLLSELEPQGYLSTHFLTLASDLERSPPYERLSFLQVELDERGVPTYRFQPGVAKTSLAHKTAARLGVTRDDLSALVQRAKAARR
ncbi:MAG: DNA mismatch repair protein [Myxococcales bacterium]|nr:DNA mismatch repair protein [Myxococcales bacterium]